MVEHSPGVGRNVPSYTKMHMRTCRHRCVCVMHSVMRVRIIYMQVEGVERDSLSSLQSRSLSQRPEIRESRVDSRIAAKLRARVGVRRQIRQIILLLKNGSAIKRLQCINRTIIMLRTMVTYCIGHTTQAFNPFPAMVLLRALQNQRSTSENQL